MHLHYPKSGGTNSTLAVTLILLLAVILNDSNALISILQSLRKSLNKRLRPGRSLKKYFINKINRNFNQLRIRSSFYISRPRLIVNVGHLAHKFLLLSEYHRSQDSEDEIKQVLYGLYNLGP